MELARLIEVLSRPGAYPHPVESVDVRQTHLSVVFLAGPFAYKIKKPVDLGFVDFRTVDQRRHFCLEEVRLNRRLAPDVYLGVVPVSGAGFAEKAAGAAVEWAVQMKRLPEEATLQARLQRGQVDVEELTMLAGRVASFHAGAEAGAAISAFGRFEVVARNARENFDQAAPQIGSTLSRAVFERLRALTEAALDRLRPLIESRAGRGVPRDSHGDLRLEHVYLFPERKPPADVVIIDCIEFNERFRFADPVADMAFLVMDLCFRSRRDLARAFAAEYFRASGDGEGRALLPFYVAYRSAVRGKVDGMKLLEAEVSEAERVAALAKARAHWLLALGEFEAPARRPWLILIGGLPGSGKSTLAQALAAQAGFSVIRSDLVRKELAGLATDAPAPAALGEGIYTAAHTEQTYAECLSRAEALLFEGRRVIIDASFGEERRRLAFLEAAARPGVPARFLHCRADPAVVRQRLKSRRGDASDADESVYHMALQRWQPFGPTTQAATQDVSTIGSTDPVLSRVLALLDQSFLWR